MSREGVTIGWKEEVSIKRRCRSRGCVAYLSVPIHPIDGLHVVGWVPGTVRVGEWVSG